MSISAIMSEPSHVDEPDGAPGYSAVLTQVAAGGQPVIVRRNGQDLAAVIPLEHLELLRELVSRQDVEMLAGRIDWDRLLQTHRPSQKWFDGEESKPF